jgi:predicted short-subunit dehydrogenase-like oxidoreductase (DUF2520 family)
LEKIKNIVLIGAGNVATHLAYAFENAGLQIAQVYSRTVESAKTLAENLYTDFTTEINDINPDADLYVISLRDDAVSLIAEKLDLKDKLVVHTSGSLSMMSIGTISKNIGVFYPLQTFSKVREVTFSDIPICIEAQSKESEILLFGLANSISNNVKLINSEEREVLHLAAVFACNFPNFMYAAAHQILQNKDLDFNLLRPLILETASKVQKMDPENAQTGPAKRADEKIMKHHLEMLKNFPAYETLYKLISAEIQKR